ncbi:sterol desaturase [Roseivirga sp. 4D4]|uniref:sterol desaturase family protein n=1 Tax=Roseivirga sp. 4D4 TaxID=1889784 RepID=UPI000852B541|nr:sterol desaturase family protein [Roseivirga sp. 4D4]OEK01873.1 sterol desaturase [Roseivirga sp. 4D4]
MESLVSFFNDVPTEFRAGILISGILIFWILEGTVPLFRFGYKKWRHAGINLFLTLTTMIIGFGLAGALLAASDLVAHNKFGLLYIIDLPLWGQLVLGVLLMDLIGAYLVHWTEHKVKWMWKFHLVHHSDTTVDVTTGLRHHPGETVFRIGFTILAVMIIGAPMWIIMVYQSLSVLFAHITHANINMPKRIDRGLSWVFITPLMHKVHHHNTQPLTDTNYGNIFSFWDRIFGTFAQVEDTTALVYGIDTHMDPKENDKMGNLLKIPFQPYRPPTGSKFGK